MPWQQRRRRQWWWWDPFTDIIMLSALNVTTNRLQHDIYEFESGPGKEKRKEEMERKSGVIVIKVRPKMKGRNA